MANQFDAIAHSSILYPNTEDLLNQSLLTPFSEQKFDLLGSKADDAPLHFDNYNSLGIYDQYNDSGPSSVQFNDGWEHSEHEGSHLSGRDDVHNGNVRPGELYGVSGYTGGAAADITLR